MALKIGSLTNTDRRQAKVNLTFNENGEVRTEEIRISFKKPTEEVWRKVSALENSEDQENKMIRAEQLVICDVQSPDILNEDGTVHQLTFNDFVALDIVNLTILFMAVRNHFFLQTPTSTSETNTSSISAQTAA